jgi:hypothetical protein
MAIAAKHHVDRQTFRVDSSFEHGRAIQSHADLRDLTLPLFPSGVGSSELSLSTYSISPRDDRCPLSAWQTGSFRLLRTVVVVIS